MDELETNDRVEPSVFGEEDDDPFAVPPALAPLPPPGEDIENIQADNGVLNDGEAAEQQTKTKKRSSQPRVKLNEERLCSPKGIAALKNLCSNIELKGKGHEESDLNKLLQQFEHWAQCLMPKWPFQNVVRQCEKLGVKRSVQNELKRLRRGDDDEVIRGESEDEEEATEVTGETIVPEAIQPPQVPEVAQPEERPASLTEEQLERIHKNRELALARREALQKRKMLAERSQQESTAEQSEVVEGTRIPGENMEEWSGSQNNGNENARGAVNGMEVDDMLIENNAELHMSNEDSTEVENGKQMESIKDTDMEEQGGNDHTNTMNEPGDTYINEDILVKAPMEPCVENGVNESSFNQMLNTDKNGTVMEGENMVNQETMLRQNNFDQDQPENKDKHLDLETENFSAVLTDKIVDQKIHENRNIAEHGEIPNPIPGNDSDVQDI